MLLSTFLRTSVRHTAVDQTDASKLALEQSHQHLTLGSRV
jgi:hypothetical protein